MGSFASKGDEDSQNTIVTKFDSATQISDRDKVEFRISLIRDEDVRRDHELALVSARDDIKDVDQRYALAEARFIDQHLKHDPSLKLSLGGTELSYEGRVAQLKENYSQSEEASAFDQERAKLADRHLADLDRSINEILKQQDRDTVKPVIDTEKHHARQKAPDLKAEFNRVR